VSRPPLVTGGTGFAGSHLIELLLERHSAVHAWSNPTGRSAPDGDPRVHWRAVDLLDREAIAREIARVRPSAVYHCGGVADVGGSWTRPALALQVNTMGTCYVLDAVRRAVLDCRVLVTGSALVYRPSREALTEDSAIGPTSPYGLSKLAQEMMTTRAAARAAIVARPFNHAGPRQSDAYVTSSFARQIAEAEAGLREPVLHVGNLESRRDITDVRDTVQAYVLLVERGQPERPYNVCSGRAYVVKDLLDMLIGMSPAALRLQSDPDRVRPSDNPIVLGNNSRIRQEAGWAPAIPIEQTLADLLDYWRLKVA